MVRNSNPVSRRTVLKSAAAVGGAGLLGAGTVSADHCSGTEAPTPQDTDFSVYIHWEPSADKGSESDAETLASHVESEFGDHVSAFSVSGVDFGDLTKSEIRNKSDKDGVLGAFGEYVEKTFYNGDWNGEQGSIDLYIYDAANWDVHPGGGGSHSSGAYDGAASGSIYNPWPACVVNGTSDGDYLGRGVHELTHMFMYQGTDEYGYNQNDHCAMEEGDGPLHSTTANFIEHAYNYSWVYYSAPDRVYECKDGDHLGNVC